MVEEWRNFVHAVCRVMWDDVVEQAEEKIKENYQGPEQQARTALIEGTREF